MMCTFVGDREGVPDPGATVQQPNHRGARLQRAGMHLLPTHCRINVKGDETLLACRCITTLLPGSSCTEHPCVKSLGVSVRLAVMPVALHAGVGDCKCYIIHPRAQEQNVDPDQKGAVLPASRRLPVRCTSSPSSAGCSVLCHMKHASADIRAAISSFCCV